MDVRKIGEHEYEVLDNENGTYMVVMPRRYCHFYKPEYVFLFKPSKNPKAKTKVVLKKTSYPLSSRIELMCDDGKLRIVSVVGFFFIAGNVFNQRGESLGPNNPDYYIKKLDFNLDRSKYDIRFTEADFIEAQTYNKEQKSITFKTNK